jgi:hypothetical protein
MNIPRRQFLRASGISLALPWLEAFAALGIKEPARRMVCICAPLGLHPNNFIPKETGRDYELSEYLKIVNEYRDQFTVVSGLEHAGMSSSFGHQASASFLTGVPGAGRPGFRNGISLDQFAASHIGSQTRFPSLALAGNGAGAGPVHSSLPTIRHRESLRGCFSKEPLPRSRSKCDILMTDTAFSMMFERRQNF